MACKASGTGIDLLRSHPAFLSATANTPGHLIVSIAKRASKSRRRLRSHVRVTVTIIGILELYLHFQAGAQVGFLLYDNGCFSVDVEIFGPIGPKEVQRLLRNCDQSGSQVHSSWIIWHLACGLSVQTHQQG